jgi:hypothetical protein
MDPGGGACEFLRRSSLFINLSDLGLLVKRVNLAEELDIFLNQIEVVSSGETVFVIIEAPLYVRTGVVDSSANRMGLECLTCRRSC